MSAGGTTVEHIDAVDAFARTLFLRTKQPLSSPDGSTIDLASVADAVRQLHLALRHLRVEAADPDSLLYAANESSQDSSLFANQLRPIVEDCSTALKQLESVLNDAASASDGAAHGRISAVRAKVLNEKSRIDVFLDTVQLRNPANAPPPNPRGPDSQATLEGIKDKVDTVATAIFARRHGDYSDDGLWKEFQVGLEKEGFAPEVLQKHKDVLRAYIRELESRCDNTGGPPPTVRGLLEYEGEELSPKEMVAPNIENEKCLASMKAERRMPHHAPVAAPPLQVPARSSQHPERPSSSGTVDSAVSDTMALISTRDLMVMDGLNNSMASMHLDRSHSDMSGNQKYLASPSLAALPAPVATLAELPGSPSGQYLSSSPRHVTSLPPYASPALAPAYGTSPGSFSRLAPDPYGNEIPLNAQWTKIKRSLVSPEVLQRAGVRYEARPEFVAILGHLSRQQIAEYARQSADVRAAREAREAPPSPRKSDKWARDRHDSKSSRSEDDDDDESVLWDESDTTDLEDDRTSEKDAKNHIYIVSPPEKEKYLSSAATVAPKSILKNKNENHVRFDPRPHEVEGKSPRHMKDDRERDRDRERTSNRHRDHGSRRHREHRDRDGRHRDYDRHYDDDRRERSHRDRGDRDRERERDRDRDRHYRDWDDDDEYSRSHHHSHRDKRPVDRKEERHMKKKAWGETLGAVGIGGAAASLLGVLAEATVGI